MSAATSNAVSTQYEANPRTKYFSGLLTNCSDTLPDPDCKLEELLTIVRESTKLTPVFLRIMANTKFYFDLLEGFHLPYPSYCTSCAKT